MGSWGFLLLTLLLPLFLFQKIRTVFSEKKHNLPPSPWSLPIFGSIHHLVGSGSTHRALRDLSQQYGELMFLQLGEQPIVVASSKEAAQEIMKMQDLTFSSRPDSPIIQIFSYGGKVMSMAPYGEYYQRMRKLCVLGLFSTNKVQSFRSIREDEVRNLVQLISSLMSERRIINVSEKILLTLNNVISRALMGFKIKNQELLLREISNVAELAVFNIASLFPSSSLVNLITGASRNAAKCHRLLDNIFNGFINERRNKGIEKTAEDFLAVLLKLHDEDNEDSISMEHIKAIFLDLISAGTESSAVTLDWIMAELMQNPRVMKKAQAEVRQLEGREYILESDLGELNYTKLIIKETLRLHPPGPLLIPRESRETCRVLGYDIPKGTTVVVNAWAIGRDSKYWQDAEDFNPERFLECNKDFSLNGTHFELIPFGAGRRMCPGMSYGLAIIELVLANLLYHFDWELPSGMAPNELDMTDTSGIFGKRKSPLWLYATQRVHGNH